MEEERAYLYLISEYMHQSILHIPHCSGKCGMPLLTFVGAPVGLFDGDADGAVEGEPLGEVVGLLQFRYDEVICE